MTKAKKKTSRLTAALLETADDMRRAGVEVCREVIGLVVLDMNQGAAIDLSKEFVSVQRTVAGHLKRAVAAAGVFL